MSYVKVCAVKDLPRGEIRQFTGGHEPIAVCNVEGDYFATQDQCTHGEWSLAEGYLDGDQIECSLHMAKFCVRTGRALCAPAWKALKVFPVSILDGDIFVDIDAGNVVAEDL